jgi:hypothetical protein
VAKLRGFYGQYEVQVKGQTLSVDLSKAGQGPVKIVLKGS